MHTWLVLVCLLSMDTCSLHWLILIAPCNEQNWTSVMIYNHTTSDHFLHELFLGKLSKINGVG